jgi:hypothetical protein
MAPDGTPRQRHLPELSLMNNNGPRDFGHRWHNNGMHPARINVLLIVKLRILKYVRVGDAGRLAPVWYGSRKRDGREKFWSEG